MIPRTLRHLGLVLAGATLIALSACAGSRHAQDTTPPPRVAPTEPRLLAEEYVEGEAVVQAINPSERRITLRDAQGRSHTVPVPADADLSRVKVGDTLLIGVYQSLSLRVLPPGSAPLGVTAAAGSTAPGQPEGRAWGQEVVVVNEVTAIDLNANAVTVRGADGRTRVVTVKDPQMQERLPNLRVGDLVELTYAETVAVKILPRR